MDNIQKCKMTKCGDCLHYPTCKDYVDENECFPEVGGCEAFKNKVFIRDEEDTVPSDASYDHFEQSFSKLE